MDMEKQRRRVIRAAFQTAFSGEAGEIVMCHLEDFAHFNDTALAPDPRLQDYIAGRRAVVCEIKNIISSREPEQE